MTHVDVGSVDDFDEGRAKAVHVEGRDLVVVKWRGQFFAASGRCPHMAASLCGGLVTAKLSSMQVGAIDTDPDSPMIGCPWHGWQFDLRTGLSMWAKDRIAVYPAQAKSGRLLVLLAARKGPEQSRTS